MMLSWSGPVGLLSAHSASTRNRSGSSARDRAAAAGYGTLRIDLESRRWGHPGTPPQLCALASDLQAAHGQVATMGRRPPAPDLRRSEAGTGVVGQIWRPCHNQGCGTHCPLRFHQPSVPNKLDTLFYNEF